MGYYDEISEGYEELHKQEQLKKIDLISRYLKPEKHEKLLDVGCGTGLTTYPWGCQRFGIDPAPKLLEKAIDKAHISYVVAPAEKIPFKDNYFDYVISITALQNFTDIDKGLKEIKRVGRDKFVLSALRRSPKISKIKSLIDKYLDVSRMIEEDKDLIFLVGIY